jgi:ATP-dependent RNA helicase DDX55/SPB4
MTPVQSVTLPLFLKHKDVCVQACTGSGKTLAFLVPIIEILCRRTVPLTSQQVGAIIISPTRELAAQICSVAQRFVDHLSGISLLSLIGGTSIEEDERLFTEAGGNIVVATPGRLKHTISSLPSFNVSQLEVLVLDEADRLLDLGFEATLNFILRRLPKQRRTGLFSATQTQEVKQLAKAGLRNPVNVTVDVQRKKTTPSNLSLSASSNLTEKQSDSKGIQMDSSVTSACVETLENYYSIVPAERKLDYLVRFLRERAKGEKVIVFFLTGAFVDYLATVLPMLQVHTTNLSESNHFACIQIGASGHRNSFFTRKNGSKETDSHLCWFWIIYFQIQYFL